jgi:Tetratricopeptide repeat
MTHRIAVIALVLTATTAQPSVAENGLAHLSVEPVHSLLVRSATAYQVFGPIDYLTVDVRLGNEDLDHTLALDAGFFEAIVWRLETVRPESSAARLREPVLLSPRVERLKCGSISAACDPSSTTQIDSDGWVIARILLRPTAGVLSPGEYRLTLDARSARRHLRETDTSPWNGRFIERGSIPLVIRALNRAEDIAQYHAVEAAAAMKCEDYTAALAHYQQMAAANPGNPAGEAGTGWALLQLGRFREAATALEHVWSRNRSRFAASQLAVAYVALGRDAEAAALVNYLYGPAVAPEVLARVRVSAKALMSRHP